MRIKTKIKEGVAILELEGNIGIDASDFVETVGWILNHQTKDIICNFEGVNLVDYLGISLISVIYKNILNHKGRIELYNVPSHVMRLFSIVGMDRIFKFHISEEQALVAIKYERERERLAKEPLRRRFKRVPFNATIEYRQKFLKSEPFCKGKIVNLSAEGVFIVSDKIFSIGDLLATRINLQPQTGIVEADVKVVWLVDEEIQAEDYPGMGLEFYNIIPEKQEKIVQFVEKHLIYPGRSNF